MTIDQLCSDHRRVALDSNVIVYVLEGVAPWASVARLLLNAIESGRLAAVLSAVGLAELCAGPARRRDMALADRYAHELTTLPGLRVVPVAVDVAVDAAVIRGIRGTSLADAIHLASARAAGATAFVTNDRRVRGGGRLEVVYLDELVA